MRGSYIQDVLMIFLPTKAWIMKDNPNKHSREEQESSQGLGTRQSTHSQWLLREGISLFNTVPAGVMLTLQKLKSFGRTKTQLRKCPHHIIWCTSLWYIVFIDDWCRLYSHLGRLFWVLQEGTLSKSNKQHLFMAPASISASSFLPLVTSLTFLCHGLLSRSVNWNKSFLPQVTLDHDVLSQQ